ncbi:hypothetical protein SMMN14_08322 [Sphaerulina musiva]
MCSCSRTSLIEVISQHFRSKKHYSAERRRIQVRKHGAEPNDHLISQETAKADIRNSSSGPSICPYTDLQKKKIEEKKYVSVSDCLLGPPYLGTYTGFAFYSGSNHNRASICCVRRISLVLKAESRLGTGHVHSCRYLLRYSADADADMRYLTF